ncbi:MAG: ribosome maturation factor RimM [Methylococcaceae bacterium]|jgi:16S rRNA processing protein RimM
MPKQVVVGIIVGAYGVRGWVKIKSHTSPVTNILKYGPWLTEAGVVLDLVEGKLHADMVVARLAGVQDRDQAAGFAGTVISVPREALPPIAKGQYYWSDLIGLDVVTISGIALGRVVGLMETGANDVLEVEGDRSRLIPFVLGTYVKDVQLDRSLMVVDWDSEF